MVATNDTATGILYILSSLGIEGWAVIATPESGANSASCPSLHDPAGLCGASSPTITGWLALKVPVIASLSSSSAQSSTSSAETSTTSSTTSDQTSASSALDSSTISASSSSATTMSAQSSTGQIYLSANPSAVCTSAPTSSGACSVTVPLSFTLRRWFGLGLDTQRLQEAQRVGALPARA